jgi:ribosome maturation factor RimP
MNLLGTGRRKTLRIFIDKDSGVNVENCANVSRFLSEELDKEENAKLIDSSYTLEVSSPGIDKNPKKR